MHQRKGCSYSKINSDLVEIESSVLRLENSDKELTKDLLKSTVNSVLKRKIIIAEEGKPVNPYLVFDEFVAQEGTEKQWAENTKRKWVTFKSHLTKYRKNFKFTDVTEAFLIGFVQFETNTLQMRDVSIQKDIKLFGVSHVTAQNYKNTILKDACIQRDRKIIVNVEKAIQLFNEHRGDGRKK